MAWARRMNFEKSCFPVRCSLVAENGRPSDAGLPRQCATSPAADAALAFEKNDARPSRGPPCLGATRPHRWSRISIESRSAAKRPVARISLSRASTATCPSRFHAVPLPSLARIQLRTSSISDGTTEACGWHIISTWHPPLARPGLNPHREPCATRHTNREK